MARGRRAGLAFLVLLALAPAAPVGASGAPRISAIVAPAEVRPGERLTISWWVDAPSGLEPIAEADGTVRPGTWMKVGGPSGFVPWCAFPTFAERIEGSTVAGRYEASCVLPPVLPNGTYSVFLAALAPGGLYAEGAELDVRVVGASDDVEAPVASEVVVTPSTPTPGSTVTLTWRVRDASGTAFAAPWVNGPNGRLVDETGAPWTGFGPGVLVGGTPQDGTFRAELPLSATAVPGRYSVWFSLADVIGNRAALLSPDPHSFEPFATFEVAASPTVTVPAATLPGTVADLSVTRSSKGRIRVSFAAATDGGSPILDYDLQHSTSPTFAKRAVLVEGGTTTVQHLDVAGLPRGRVVYLRVRATNAVGHGAWSAPVAVRR